MSRLGSIPRVSRGSSRGIGYYEMFKNPTPSYSGYGSSINRNTPNNYDSSILKMQNKPIATSTLKSAIK